MKLVFVDIETGGLDPSRHPIIQLAAVASDESMSPIEHFECKIDFDLSQADADALSKNNYNAERWKIEAVEVQAAINRFSSFLKRHSDVEMISKKTGKPYYVAQLIGHNAPTFDAIFIQNLWRCNDRFLPASYRVLCTMQRAMFYFFERPQINPPKDFKLGSLCEYFKVPLTEAHDAKNDVMATLALYGAIRNAEQSSI